MDTMPNDFFLPLKRFQTKFQVSFKDRYDLIWQVCKGNQLVDSENANNRHERNPGEPPRTVHLFPLAASSRLHLAPKLILTFYRHFAEVPGCQARSHTNKLPFPSADKARRFSNRA